MATTKVERIMIELGLDSSKFSADVDKVIQKNRELDKALSTTEKTARQAVKTQSELVKKYQYSTEKLASFLQDMTRLKEQVSRLLNVITEKTSLNKLAGDATKLLDQLVKSSEIINSWQKAFSSFGINNRNLTTALNDIKEALNGLAKSGQANMSPYLLSFVSGMNDSKLSVDSLKTAFHLAKTVKNDVMPELVKYSNIMNKLKQDNQSVKLEKNQKIIRNRSTAENHIPAGFIKSQSPTRSKTQVESKTLAKNKTLPQSKELTRNKTSAQQKIPVKSKTSIQSTLPTLSKTLTSNKVSSAKVISYANNIKSSENIADKAREVWDYFSKDPLKAIATGIEYFSEALIAQPLASNMKSSESPNQKKTANSVPEKGNMYYAQQIYNSLREHEFSEQQARIMVAEIGRENSFNPDYLFGTHGDPKNRQPNIGLISWQGDRAKGLIKRLTEKGLYKNGKITRSKASIDEMVEYMRYEISNISSFSKTKNEFLSNPNIAYDKGNRILGTNYIIWRINDPKYKNGHKRRDAFFKQTADMERVYKANRISKKVSQNNQLLRDNIVTQTGNRKYVNVHIQNINVKTSANTVSGNTVAALKEAHNYLFNQLGTSVT